MESTKRHPHTGEPVVPIGYRKDGREIWPVIGASEDDDGPEVDGVDVDTDDDPTASATEPEADPTALEPDADGFVRLPATELKKVQDSLARANDQARRRREELQTLRRERATPDEAAQAEIVDRVTAEQTAKWKPLVVRGLATSALTEAGLVGNPARMLAQIKMDEIEVDDDGTLLGLDGEIARLKTDFPELFKKVTKVQGRVNGGGDGAPLDDTSKPQTSAQKLAARLNS